MGQADAKSAESFDDGWFRTGDMAVLERGYYRIMGRLSVDIIKSGRNRLSVYKIPQRLLVVDELPRNAIGKVTKPALRALF